MNSHGMNMNLHKLANGHFEWGNHGLDEVATSSGPEPKGFLLILAQRPQV